jgi:hypothetical protein
LVAFLAWKWFPRLENRAADTSRVRLLRWAAVVVALVIVAMAVLPRRFIWEKFELVVFDDQPALVIGSNSEEFLLYSADGDERKRWRVPRNAATLQRTGQVTGIFDPR